MSPIVQRSFVALALTSGLCLPTWAQDKAEAAKPSAAAAQKATQIAAQRPTVKARTETPRVNIEAATTSKAVTPAATRAATPAVREALKEYGGCHGKDSDA